MKSENYTALINHGGLNVETLKLQTPMKYNSFYEQNLHTWHNVDT